MTKTQSEDLIAPIKAFLGCETPDAWIEIALENEHLMLIDHANCEKKAASTAVSLIFRYTDRPELLMKMSKLAREELRHFEQVLQILKYVVNFQPAVTYLITQARVCSHSQNVQTQKYVA